MNRSISRRVAVISGPGEIQPAFVARLAAAFRIESGVVKNDLKAISSFPAGYDPRLEFFYVWIIVKYHHPFLSALRYGFAYV